MLVIFRSPLSHSLGKTRKNDDYFSTTFSATIMQGCGLPDVLLGDSVTEANQSEATNPLPASCKNVKVSISQIVRTARKTTI